MHSEKKQKTSAQIKIYGILALGVIGVLVVGSIFWCGFGQHDLDNQQLAEKWQHILRTQGCLMGMQDWQKGVENTREFRQGCILAMPPFQKIIHADPDVVRPFLLAKLTSNLTTPIHVCPYEDAVEGEFALYILQYVTHRNWHEYQGDNPFIAKQITLHRAVLAQDISYSPMTTDQHLIRKILNNPESRNALIKWYSE